MSVVKPDVLCMDAYPNFAAANLTTAADAYLFVLAVLRANALQAVPALNFWNFFGTQHVFGDSPDPSEAQARQTPLPPPILPKLSVLTRACFWCLGAPIRVLTSPRM